MVWSDILAMEISSEVAAQYLPKEVVRKIQSTEVNQCEIKKSSRSMEDRKRRHAAMRDELRNSSMYAKHMRWLNG